MEKMGDSERQVRKKYVDMGIVMGGKLKVGKEKN